jgi:uncharacterized membrane protein YbhN (UPF0104 family)
VGRSAFKTAAGLAVVAVAFLWALPRFADYGQVWSSLTDLDRSVLPLLAVVAAANLLAPSMSQRAALPRLGLRDAVAVDWVTTTVTNLLPGGSAVAIGLTWSMYRTCGLARDAIARSIVVTGLWDAFIKLGTPLLAISWLATQRTVGFVLIQAAVIGAVLFAIAAGLLAALLSGPGTARRLGAGLDRLPMIGDGWPERIDTLRRDTVVLLSGRWRSLTFWTVAGHANLYLLLVLCGRAVGLGADVLGWAAVLTAFAFGRLVTAVPITPGGLGVMELGLVSAIGATTEAPDAPVVAAVLLFRFLTLILPMPLGAASWIWWSGFRRALRDTDDDLAV